jgi:hypothetical protein
MGERVVKVLQGVSQETNPEPGEGRKLDQGKIIFLDNTLGDHGTMTPQVAIQIVPVWCLPG